MANYMNYGVEDTIFRIFIKKPKYLERTIVKPEYFETPEHQRYFIMFRDMYEQHGTLDYDMFKGAEGIDTREFVMWAGNNLSDASEVGFHQAEDRLIDEYKLRRCRELSNDLASKKIDYNQFCNKITSLQEIQSTTELVKIGSDTVNDFLSKKESNKLAFDRLFMLDVVNIKEQDLIFLSAKTGRGKTAFALNIASDLSKSYPILYLNLEMSGQVITQRLLASNTNTRMKILDEPYKMNQNDVEKAMDYGKVMDDREMYVYNGSITLEKLKSVVSDFPQDRHYIVILDHVGLVQYRARTEREKINEVVRQLRNLSLDYNCTIFALSQLSRQEEQARPHLNMLKESGEIENSSRKVLMLWEDVPEEYKLYVLKNDSGPLRVFDVLYDKEMQRMDLPF